MATSEDARMFLAKVREYDRGPSKRLAVEIYDEFLNPRKARPGFIRIPDGQLHPIQRVVAEYRESIEARDREFAGQGILGRIERSRTAAAFKAVPGIFRPAVVLIEMCGFMPARPHPMQAFRADPAVVDEVKARLRGLDAMALMCRGIAQSAPVDLQRAINRVNEWCRLHSAISPLGGATETLLGLMVRRLEESRLTVNFNARDFFSLPLDQIGTSYRTCWQRDAKSPMTLVRRNMVESQIRPFGKARNPPTPADAVWTPDAKVTTCQHRGCNATLRMFNRHHCRLCGRLFCSAHSSHTLSILNPLGPNGRVDGLRHHQRVCDECFTTHSESSVSSRARSAAVGNESDSRERIVRNEIETYADRLSESFQGGMRPQYAALDFLNAACGGAPQYGRSFFVYHPAVKANATFTHSDTFDQTGTEGNWGTCLAMIGNMYPLVTGMNDDLFGKLVVATLRGGVEVMMTGDGEPGNYGYLEAQVHTEGVYGRDIVEMHISEAEVRMLIDPTIPEEILEVLEDKFHGKLRGAGSADEVRRKVNAFAGRFGIEASFFDDTAYAVNFVRPDSTLPKRPWQTLTNP